MNQQWKTDDDKMMRDECWSDVTSWLFVVGSSHLRCTWYTPVTPVTARSGEVLANTRIDFLPPSGSDGQRREAGGGEALLWTQLNARNTFPAWRFARQLNSGRTFVFPKKGNEERNNDFYNFIHVIIIKTYKIDCKNM